MTKVPETPTIAPRPLAPTAPPEGPHARAGLIDPEKTPGSGMFPQPGTKESEPPAG
ncbi:MAG: hypothetical protein K2X45_13270 [Phreatobacter sp.]|jgi:hypothetical protein|nr:hypothetical protein [Phreatobacter sp.]